MAPSNLNVYTLLTAPNEQEKFLRAIGNISGEQEKFQPAIRQRDPTSQDYIPHFSVPQL